MALSAKPVRPALKPAAPADPVEAFISKGGSVPQPEAPAAVEAATKGAQHPLKFPADSDLFERLERARKASAVRLPRNTWILQAIAEKLARDSG
ncbi:hypothetical protein [Methylobacterium sp. CM6257]